MTDAEKIKILANALNAANTLLFFNGATHGTKEYFELRKILVDGLKIAEQKVA